MLLFWEEQPSWGPNTPTWITTAKSFNPLGGVSQTERVMNFLKSRPIIYSARRQGATKPLKTRRQGAGEA